MLDIKVFHHILLQVNKFIFGTDPYFIIFFNFFYNNNFNVFGNILTI